MESVGNLEISLEKSLGRFESQETLFATRPSRLSLLQLPPTGRPAIQKKVNIWRNHNIESLLPVLEAYLAFGDIQIQFEISSYDHSFSFEGRKEADAEIIWLDSDYLLTKLSTDEIVQWLQARILDLRRSSKAPIVVATWFADKSGSDRFSAVTESLPGVHFANLKSVPLSEKVALTDPRTAALAGTPLTPTAQLFIARELACHWLPGALLPPVKAIALDLDNTLHHGVLGEDGIAGVKLTPEHISFQSYVKNLQKKGIFITLVSRNNHADVEKLFAERTDYPLRWSDFTTVEVSWDEKWKSIQRIAKKLNIGTDAILFVDDNIGELANVLTHLPQTRTVYGHQDAAITQRAVHYFPGLWRWKAQEEDAKRVQDAKANFEREALANEVDPAEYFRQLQVTLTFHLNPVEQLSRLTDLCNKTNQFNLSLRRFNETEVAERLKSPNASIVSVRLSDRLADSGIIAIIVAEKTGKTITVEELCISCRAMGRKLESTIVLKALQQMPIFSGSENVIFKSRQGPRNQPALEWLQELIGHTPNENETVTSSSIRSFSPPDGVRVHQENMQ